MKLPRGLQDRGAYCVASSLLASSPNLQVPQTSVSHCMTLDGVIQITLIGHKSVLNNTVNSYRCMQLQQSNVGLACYLLTTSSTSMNSLFERKLSPGARYSIKNYIPYQSEASLVAQRGEMADTKQQMGTERKQWFWQPHHHFISTPFRSIFCVS
jgi:hypothetical protein